MGLGWEYARLLLIKEAPEANRCVSAIQVDDMRDEAL